MTVDKWAGCTSRLWGRAMAIWNPAITVWVIVWSFCHGKHRSFFWEYSEKYIRLANRGQDFQLHPLQFKLLFPWPRPSQDFHHLGQDRALWLSKGHHPHLLSAQGFQTAECFLVQFSFAPSKGSWKESPLTVRKVGAHRRLTELPKCYTGVKWQGWHDAAFWLPTQGSLDLLFLQGTATFL